VHATGGCSGRQADSGRTGEAGCCAADVEGTIGAAEVAEAACPTTQSGASCACVACGSVHTSGGRELRRVRVASRRVGLVDVLWHDFHQSPSRHQEQREQLQWPFECTSAMGEQQLRRKRPAGGGSVPESTGAAADDASAVSFARLASLSSAMRANPCARAASTAGLGVFLLCICRAQRS
jgi:hypothetical protein